MAPKRIKKDPERAKPPPDPVQQQQQERSGKDITSGLSGRGADSVLAHLIEQEKTRDRKRS